MAENFKQREQPQNINDPAYAREKLDDTPGLRGERIVGEFIQESFNNIFKKVERTSRYDRNDTKGVDYVMEAIDKDGKVCRFAVDITFDADERMQMKKKRTLMNPCVNIHGEDGKIIAEKIPRLLIHGGNMGFWFMQEDEAKRRGGGPLIDVMPNNEKIKKRKDVLKQIMTQIIGLSQKDSDYAKRVKLIRKTFEQEAERLKISY